MSIPTDMVEGQRVKVRLHGDDRWYSGIVLDRPRKMWVELEDYGRPHDCRREQYRRVATMFRGVIYGIRTNNKWDR